MSNPLLNRRGSSLIYVVFLMVLLGAIAASYSFVLTFGAQSVSAQKVYDQTNLLASSLRQALVDSIKSNANPAAIELERQYNADLELYFQALDEYQDALDEYEEERDSYEGEPGGMADAIGPAPVKPNRDDYVKPLYQLNDTTSLDIGELYVKHEFYEEGEEDSKTLNLQLTMQLTHADGKVYPLGALLVAVAEDIPRESPEKEDEEEEDPKNDTVLPAPKYALSVGNSGNPNAITIQSTDASAFNGDFQSTLYGNITSRGDIISTSTIFISGGTYNTNSSLYANGTITLSGARKNVSGDIYSLSNIVLENSDKNISGSIYGQGAISITGSNNVVGGSLFSNQGVTLAGTRLYGGIFNNGLVSIGTSQIDNGIVSNGNVSVTWGSTINNGIHSAGNVTLSGCTVNGDIIAGGTVNLSNSAHVYGRIYANEIVTNGNFSTNGAVVVKTPYTGSGFFVQGITNNPALELPVPNVPTPIEAGDFTPLTEVSFIKEDMDYKNAATNKGSISSMSNSTIEANDSFYTITSNTTLRDISFSGSGRVFLVVSPGVTLTLQGTIGDIKDADRLFIITPTASSSATLYTMNNTTINGQIYMPGGTLQLDTMYYANRSPLTVNGCVTIGTLKGQNTDVLVINYVEGDYGPSSSGGNSSGEGDGDGQVEEENNNSTVLITDWIVRKYYDEDEI